MEFAGARILFLVSGHTLGAFLYRSAAVQKPHLEETKLNSSTFRSLPQVLGESECEGEKTFFFF